ncbi:hypothetical protein EP7_002090 [Isosphaeraceae bacterium EP7]
MRRANVTLAATLAVVGTLMLGGCGSAENDGGKIDLSEQYITTPKTPPKPVPLENLSPLQKRARRAAEAQGKTDN